MTTKRVVDLILSIFTLILFFPLISVMSIISFIAQGNPIFFIHKRIGLNRKPFNMVKFRTMKLGPSISASDDEKRITKWGRFLRTYSIDELPTIYNVLKGNMSFVGPRPLPVKYLDRFSEIELNRFLTKPGITGLAQIKGRNKTTWRARFKYDLFYLKKKSVFLDLKIILKTIFLVLIKKGTSSYDSEIMPEFLGSKKNKK